jgi:hypothetical protein
MRSKADIGAPARSGLFKEVKLDRCHPMASASPDT